MKQGGPMRNIELNELNLKNNCDEELLYQLFPT